MNVAYHSQSLPHNIMAYSDDENGEQVDAAEPYDSGDEVPTKRRKLGAPEGSLGGGGGAGLATSTILAESGVKKAEWTVYVTNPQELKTYLKVIGEIVTMAHFKVQHDGLLCESINQSKTCMFKMNMGCKVTMSDEQDGEDVYFCVNIDLFIAAIQVEQAELLIFKDGDHIRVRSGSIHNCSEDNIIDTLSDDHVSLPVMNMQMEYGVDISLSVLRAFCKPARERRAEDIRITLKRPAEDLGDGLKHVFVELFADCVGIKKTRVMHSATKVEGGAAAAEPPQDGGALAPDQYVVRVTGSNAGGEGAEKPLAHYGELTTLYSGRFQLSFLESLIKHMKGDTVHLHFSKNKPLIVRYGLGTGQSHIYGVIVAKKDR